MFAATTKEGQTLTFRPATPLKGIRYVRIETTFVAGGLWPAWHDISILGR